MRLIKTQAGDYNNHTFHCKNAGWAINRYFKYAYEIISPIYFLLVYLIKQPPTSTVK